MALCQVSQVPDATFASVHLGSWLLAALTGLAIQMWFDAKGRSNPWLAAGIAVMAVPAWAAVCATFPDMVRTFCAQGDLNQVIVPGQVAPPESRSALSGQYIASILGNLGYLAVGAILVWRGRTRDWRSPTVRGLAVALRGLLPLGRGEARSFTLGLALFPFLAVANLLLAWLTAGSGIRTGDDSHVFDEISALQVVLLALAAGVGEELVYRGVMQQGLKRLVPGPRWAGVAAGMGVQSIVFAYAHAGYQNLEHLLFAFLFALVAGLAVELLGIWSAIVLHALVDFYAFVLSTHDPGPWLPLLANAIGLLALGTCAWQCWSVLKGWFRRPRPQ